MSPSESYAVVQRFEGDDGLRNDGRRRCKCDDVSKRTGGGRAAKRAVLEMTMRSRVLVRMMRRHRHGSGCGTQHHPERRAARRHKANGNIGPKQEGYQQQAG